MDKHKEKVSIGTFMEKSSKVKLYMKETFTKKHKLVWFSVGDNKISDISYTI